MVDGEAIQAQRVVTQLLRLVGNEASCKGCGEKIVWVVTKNGKRMPLDPDGTPHWASCPAAPEFRKPKHVQEELPL